MTQISGSNQDLLKLPLSHLFSTNYPLLWFASICPTIPWIIYNSKVLCLNHGRLVVCYMSVHSLEVHVRQSVALWLMNIYPCLEDEFEWGQVCDPHWVPALISCDTATGLGRRRSRIFTRLATSLTTQEFGNYFTGAWEHVGFFAISAKVATCWSVRAPCGHSYIDLGTLCFE